MTQEEIRDLRSKMNQFCIDCAVMPDDIIEEFNSMTKRLAILEAAVAWHGFDEVPEEGKEIDLVTDDGDIDREAGGDGLHDTESYQFHGFTGWRYSVGDLSSETELKAQSIQTAAEKQLEDDLISGSVPLLSGDGIVPGSLRIAK